MRGYEFQAIVDQRTTVTCSYYSGMKFRVNDPSVPIPPLHYQCRSTILPIMFDQEVAWDSPQPPLSYEHPVTGEVGSAAPFPGFGDIPAGVSQNVTFEQVLQQL